MLRLELLGPADLICTDGSAVCPVLRQPKRLALLAYLALARPRGLHRRDHLLALFWPEKDEEHARSALNQALYFLRRSLGEDAISSRGDGDVGVSGLTVDVVEFETMAAGADTSAALELYRGPLLDGFHLTGAPEFDRWLDAERARLQHVAWEAALDSAGRAAGNGDLSGAVAFARRATEIQPYNDPSARTLMQLLHRAGDRAEALRVYERFKKDLEEELQAEPEVETSELAEAIRAGTDAATGPEGESGAPIGVRPRPTGVLVLPFVNRSADPQQDYLADGLTEEIITDLSRIPAIRVISRNSAMRLKGTTKTTRVVAQEMGVSHVLSGSVRREDGMLRMVVELVEAATDSPVWAERYTGTSTDVFDMQERMARAIVDALPLEACRGGRRQLQRRPIPDVRAHECYLRARHEMWRFDADGLRRALGLLEEALEIVGDNALLHATKGLAFLQLVNSMTRTDDEPLRMAEASADRCLALEPDMAQGHALRGMVAWFRGDWREAYRNVRIALSQGWQDPETLIWATCIYSYGGQLSAARETAAHLRAIDPLAAVGHVVTGLGPFMTGRFPEALEHMTRGYEADPNHMVAGFLASTLRHLGRAEEATRLLRDTPAVLFQEWMTAMLLAGWEGRRNEVLGLADSEYAASARRLGIWSLWVAESHALVGADTEALDWLDTAVDRGLLYPPFLARHDRLLSTLHGSPTFEALLARATREWEDFSLEVSALEPTYDDM